FDRVMLFEGQYLRGRKSGEIMGLFRKGVALGCRAKQVDEVQGALIAVQLALASVQAGDLLVIQADVVDETVEFLERYLAGGDRGREISFQEAVVLGQPATASVAGGSVEFLGKDRLVPFASKRKTKVVST